MNGNTVFEQFVKLIQQECNQQNVQNIKKPYGYEEVKYHILIFETSQVSKFFVYILRPCKANIFFVITFIRYFLFMDNRYRKASGFYKKFFPGRVQKISIDAGFTCPNRDGTKGYGGCTYCNNDVFMPFFCKPDKSITEQLNEGIRFFGRKYKASKYLAYFQAYSNTYAPLDRLKEYYEEALAVDGVEGLVIATRPDCVNEEILEYLAELSNKYFVLVEYGVESVYDSTLEYVNRGHGFEESKKALVMTKEYGINAGVHLILGLPGETRDMMLNAAKIISQLPVTLLKLHQLQIVKGTVMEKDYAKHPGRYNLFSAEEYIEFVIDFLEYLNPDIYIERFTSEAPKNLLVAPKWGGIKNYEITHKIVARMKERDSYQGKKFIPLREVQY